MRLRLGSVIDLVTELPSLGATMLALVATLVLEHFFVHRLIVLPTLAFTPHAPFWMFAAMIVPELVVCFVAGYRLRTWAALVMYAGVGGLLRGGFHLALELAREPGHYDGVHERFSEFAVRAPLVAIGYLVVLAVAASSGDDERRLAGDA